MSEWGKYRTIKEIIQSTWLRRQHGNGQSGRRQKEKGKPATEMNQIEVRGLMADIDQIKMKESVSEMDQTETWRAEVEERISELPVVQYAWLREGEIPFSERVRSICREECPRYGTSWACPPGVGSVTECRERCGQFSGAFVFTTIAEVADADNLTETLATRPAHEAVTRQIQEVLRPYVGKMLALSAESCAICKNCAYPDGPCRHPDRMVPCVEGYGIVVPQLAARAGIEFMNGAGIVTWFGIVLYAEAGK